MVLVSEALIVAHRNKYQNPYENYIDVHHIFQKQNHAFESFLLLMVSEVQRIAITVRSKRHFLSQIEEFRI